MATHQYSYQESVVLLGQINQCSKTLAVECDAKSHTISLFSKANNAKIASFRLPLPCPKIDESKHFFEYIAQIDAQMPPYIVVLIQAGSCALGYFENGEVVLHKVIKKYMVRKKQGQNQLTYLNNGGKGNSEGGQLRYRNAIRFFEDINQKLCDWNAQKRLTKHHKIIFSCPIALKQYLYSSKIPCLYPKKDPRWQKICRDVSTPNFEELMVNNQFAVVGQLTVINDIFWKILDNK